MTQLYAETNAINQIGYFVYQYAKLCMLEFYYDFITAYIPRPLFQYCAMDTDSAYLALAGRDVDELVEDAKREHYFRHRGDWFPAECCDDHADAYVHCRLAGRPRDAPAECCAKRRKYDKRTPGLFKEEWSGRGIITLYTKTYYCYGAGGDKYSKKGLSKRQNDNDKDVFLAVLRGQRSGNGWNRGFQVKESSVLTYIQERAALSYFYAKRRVLDDGVTTAPILV